MLKELRARRTKTIADMRAMIEAAEKEDRDLTAEEREAFDALKGERDGLDARIARLEGQEETESTLTASRGTVAGGPQLAAIPRRGPEARREFENVGEFIHAVRFRPNDQRLQFVEHTAANDENGELRAEMRTDDGPSGGFALPPQFRNTLFQVDPAQAIIRPRATVIEPGSPPDGPITMTALDQTGAAPGNVFGGVQVQWIEEGAEKPETDLKIREITWTPHEVAGTLTVTDKLLRNWAAANSLIETQMRGAVTQAEDFAFHVGNGVGKPLGVLKAGATYRVNRATANQISYDDLIAVEERMLGDQVWYYSLSVLPQLRKLTNPQGQYIWTPSAQQGVPDLLLGRPAMLDRRGPLLGQPGDLWSADLSKYVIKDGSGPFFAASEHVYFTQNKTVVKIFWNVDGSPWLTAPFEDENGWTVSPFVMLDVPSV